MTETGLLTLQEAFDRAVGGVLRQGRMSGSGNACYYRYFEDSDTRCPVGWLIPDAEYKTSMEYSNVSAILKNYSITGISRDVHCDLLMSLQSAHDRAVVDSHPLDYFIEKVKLTASYYELKWNFSKNNTYTGGDGDASTVVQVRT